MAIKHMLFLGGKWLLAFLIPIVTTFGMFILLWNWWMHYVKAFVSTHEVEWIMAHTMEFTLAFLIALSANILISFCVCRLTLCILSMTPLRDIYYHPAEEHTHDAP
jgi:hypothetical protein